MNAVSPTINENVDRLTLEYRAVLVGGRTSEDRLDDRFLALQRRLRVIQRSNRNEEETPTDFADEMATRILLKLRELAFPPDDLVTSAEGGIAFCFSRAGRYADIEVLNSKEVLAVISNRKDQPVVWTVDQSSQGISKALVKIRDYFKGA